MELDVHPAYLEGEIDGQVHQFPLAAEHIFRIGRGEKNNVVINDDLASRHHAMLQHSADERVFYVTDLGSSNGTFVNNVRVCAPLILRDGDQIRIGNHEFSFRQVSVSPPQLGVPSAELQPTTNVLFAPSLITVLVVDIRDFTGLARRVDASRLSRLTAKLFREAGKSLQQHGAWTQKYIGDAVMAVWLHEKCGPQFRELIAVFESLSRLAGIASGLQAQFQLSAPIRIGAGLNTGWASVGNVGSIAFSDYTALGDVVNKAFRLESATKEMSCDLALGQGTYDFLSSSIKPEEFFQTCTVKLKGYDEPAIAYVSNMGSLPDVLKALNRGQEHEE